MNELFAAILAIEGWLGPGTVGAAGEIGPYQITRAYWQDARMDHGTHADCEDEGYSREVMYRYWLRYCPQALESKDISVLAGVHHWGPKGAKREWRRRDTYVARVLAFARRRA